MISYLVTCFPFICENECFELEHEILSLELFDCIFQIGLIRNSHFIQKYITTQLNAGVQPLVVKQLDSEELKCIQKELDKVNDFLNANDKDSLSTNESLNFPMSNVSNAVSNVQKLKGETNILEDSIQETSIFETLELKYISKYSEKEQLHLYLEYVQNEIHSCFITFLNSHKSWLKDQELISLNITRHKNDIIKIESIDVAIQTSLYFDEKDSMVNETDQVVEK